MTSRRIENFGRNRDLHPTAYYEPQNESEVLDILNRHRMQSIRTIGSLHSWSEAICGDGVVLSLRNLTSIEISTTGSGSSAVVGAGVQIKHLLQFLKHHGKTLPSVGLITEQTIAGAISTGTHGSGKHSLSHYVIAVRLARYDSDSGNAIVEEIHSGDALLAIRCSLGCLGVILRVQIQVRDLYNVEEHWREYRTLENVMNAEQEYPLQQFFLTPWKWTFLAQHRRETSAKRSWFARLYRVYWFALIDIALHLLLLLASRIVKSATFVQLLYRYLIPSLVIRRWRVVDDSSDMLVMEHELFRHIETELFVPRRHLEAALSCVREVLRVAGGTTENLSSELNRDLQLLNLTGRTETLRGVYCHHYPICVRRIKNDATLISMASPETDASDIGDPSSDWYSISLVSYEAPSSRMGYIMTTQHLSEIMARLFHARPHWGKLCLLPPDRQAALYRRFEEFRMICRQQDPNGVFSNTWTSRLLKGEC